MCRLPLVSPEQVVAVVVLEAVALEAELEEEPMGLVEVVEEPKLGTEVPSEDKVSARSKLVKC